MLDAVTVHPRMTRFGVLALLGCTAQAPDPAATPTDAPRSQTPRAESPVPPTEAEAAEIACATIARDLIALRRRYRALASMRAVVEDGECTFSLAYHVGAPAGGAGYAGGIPVPQDDGVWFHLELYDPTGPNAMSQVNSQPVLPPWWIGARRVTWLARSGARATVVDGKTLEQAVWEVVRSAGLREP